MAMQFRVAVEIEGFSLLPGAKSSLAPKSSKLGLCSLTKKDQALNSTPITICQRMSRKSLEASP